MFKMKLNTIKSMALTGFLVSSMLLFSCDAKQIAIDYGKDDCAQCKMTIMDKRYGSEIITQKGKIFKFDSIECMANYYHSHVDEQKKIKTFLITDFSKAPAFIDATKAYFLKSENLPSPMGANLTGFAELNLLEKVKKEKSGKNFTWNQILDLFKKK